jgi:type III pantothenate kinase
MQPDDFPSSPDLIVLGIAVGNTRTRIGRIEKEGVSEAESFTNGPAPGLGAGRGHEAEAPIDEMVAKVVALGGEAPAAAVVIASVNDPVADLLDRALRQKPVLAGRVYRLGKDIAIPITHTIDEGSMIGQDRLLCALAAFERARQACVVIDAGTAVTVDFVDGTGVFHGGAIAPGASMMLRSLHEWTAVLPLLTPGPLAETDPAWGANTQAAMQLGMHAAMKGLVRFLVDRYAEAYGAYPQVIATGGDAPLLFKDEPLVEHVVTDLQLRGLWLACAKAIEAEDAEVDE